MGTMRLSIVVASLVAVMSAATSQAGVIASYQFAGGDPASRLQVTAADGNVVASDLTNGAAATLGAANAYYASAPVLIATRGADNDAGQYIEFTVTSAGGYALDLSAFGIDGAKGGSSDPRTIAVHDSVDGLDLASPAILSQTLTVLRPASTATTGSMGSYSTDLSAAAYQGLASVMIRVYFDTSVTGSSVDLDNLVLSGSVVPVPEPASLGLLAVAGLGLMRRRSR